MALDVNEVRVTVDGILRKNQISGYLTTSLFNKLAKKIQLEYFDDKRVEWESTKTVTAQIQELSEEVTLHPTNGVVTLPTDFWQSDTARLRVYYKVRGEDETAELPIEEVSNSEWDSRIGSRAFRPDNYNAILRIRNGNIEVLPSTIQEFDFAYLRYPADPVWVAISPVVNNREQYDVNASTQFEVPQDAFQDIVDMFLKEIGISTRDGEMVQYGYTQEQINGK